METIRTELVTGTSKRDRRGRKILSEAQWRETLASYECSELTQREFCRREGIKLHTFVGRRWQHRQTRPAVGPAFVEAKLPSFAFAGSGQGLEVMLPDGVVVRGREAVEVAALVRGLGGR